MAVTQERHRPPFDAAGLEAAALRYVGRYAVTRAKLRTYLVRKLRERGWAGEGEPAVEAIDDQACASARSEALGRRGYGARRVSQALLVAGISEEDGAAARASAAEAAWSSAIRFAQRKRIGPYGTARLDGPAREKALAAMLRAGHPMGIARRLVSAAPGESVEPDE
jgi:regulatory protein